MLAVSDQINDQIGGPSFRPFTVKVLNSNFYDLTDPIGPDFNRLTLGALWADARLGFGYAPLLDGCAVVSDTNWIREPARHLGAWMPCPVRVYDNDHLDEAAAWLSSICSGRFAPGMAQETAGCIRIQRSASCARV